MKRVFPVALILLGSSLEVWYYVSRYRSEGAGLAIAVVQGVALTLLLMGLFRLRKSRAAWLLIVPLAVYSVVNTAAGQREALVAAEVAEVAEVNDAQIADLERQRDRKLARYAQVEALLAESVQSFEDAWHWRNTTERYEAELDGLDGELAAIEDEILALRSPTADQGDLGDLYRFYSELTGVAPRWLQFLLQVAFSLFIAVMAPVGILLLPAPAKQMRPPPRPPEPSVPRETVGVWVQANWQGNRERLLSSGRLVSWAKSNGYSLTEQSYASIARAAQAAGVIDGDRIVIKEPGDALREIMRRL